MIKKLSMILAVIFVMTLVMPLSGSALYGYKREDLDKYNVVDHIYFSVFGDYKGNAAIEPEQTRPNDEIIIPLLAEGFRDDLGNVIDWGHNKNDDDYGPDRWQVRTSRVTPKLEIIKGRNFIRDISIVSYTPDNKHLTHSAIRIRFIEELQSTEEITYQFQIRLYIGGKKEFVTSEVFGGRLANRTYDAYNKDYVYIGDGTVVDSKNSINGLELGLDNEIRMFVDTQQGRKYYGIAKHFDNQKDSIAKEYPEILDVYDVKSVGLKAAVTKVYIDLPEGTTPRFVYDVDGDFVGLSNEALPYSNRYYLSTKELEIDLDLIDESLIDKNKVEVDTYEPAALKTFRDGIEKDKGMPAAPKEYK